VGFSPCGKLFKRSAWKGALFRNLFSPYIHNPTKNRTFVYATKSRPIFETREPTEGRDGLNPRTNPANSRPVTLSHAPPHQSQSPHPPPFEFSQAALGSHGR
jgi:hypothetical protein